jgi:hypothetical protein
MQTIGKLPAESKATRKYGIASGMATNLDKQVYKANHQAISDRMDTDVNFRRTCFEGWRACRLGRFDRLA